jgi:sugar O-acyltransferase (sialic acid O-acetyltransferase NeuD family)
MEDIILVGFGGHAKSVADCIERQGKYSIIGYTDFEQYDSKYRYLGTDDVLSDYYGRGVKNAVICIGYLGKGNLRQRKYRELKDIGYSFPVIADPSAIISETAELGEGTFVGKAAVINAGARVGSMAIINTMALVEHECIVGDFVHVAVSAVLCGQVEVGEAAFIGANATVIQCMKIGENQIVPAGVTIRKTIRKDG